METSKIILIAALVAGGVMLVSGLGIVYMWLKYSWLSKYRVNSKNYQGKDAARIILDKSEMNDVSVHSSFFFIKYWNHNFRRRTFKLKPWTHSRKSVWTMMETTQQTFVSTLRKTKRASFILFRFPFIFRFLGFAFGIAGIYIAFKYGGDSKSTKFIIYLLIALGGMTTILSYAEIYKLRILQKNVVPIVENDLKLNANEVTAIKRIYRLKMVFAVAYAIYETLKLLAQILKEASKQVPTTN